MSDQVPVPSRKTAPNVRLVDPLKTQAAAKAKYLGISLNALVALAVRQYLDGLVAAPSQPDLNEVLAQTSNEVLAQTLFAAFDQALASPSPQRGAPRQLAASAVGGRGARLPSKSVKRKGPTPAYSLRRRHGHQLEAFLTSPSRFVPSGIVGASFHHEYLMSESYSDRLWEAKGGNAAVWRDVIRNGKPL